MITMFLSEFALCKARMLLRPAIAEGLVCVFTSDHVWDEIEAHLSEGKGESGQLNDFVSETLRL
jgi:hypothetical protein